MYDDCVCQSWAACINELLFERVFPGTQCQCISTLLCIKRSFANAGRIAFNMSVIKRIGVVRSLSNGSSAFIATLYTVVCVFSIRHEVCSCACAIADSSKSISCFL